MAIASVVVPTMIVLFALFILGRKASFSSGRVFSVFLVGCIVYGVLIRFILAPATGHPVDMETWTDPIRLFYGSGVVDVRLYPLPFTYYPVLASYSPYALLQVLGFHDISFLSHQVGMVESVFIKFPFIFSDIFSFYFLYKILGRLNADDRSKRLAYALLYFLSPIVILSSSAWPLADGIAVALFLAGIYYALLEEKPVIGSIFFALSGFTKIFGFLGFVPLAVDLVRKHKFSKLLIIIGVFLFIAFLLYLPLINFSGIGGVSTFFTQFLKGRAGFGSSFGASDTYLSYLSFIGFPIDASFQTYLLGALFASVTIYYIFKVRKLNLATKKSQFLDLTFLYFALFFFIFYLTFYKVYQYYYLLVIPFLIIYAYSKRESGSAYAAVILSLVSAPIFLLGPLVSGTDYYWIPLNIPADTQILAVIPSTVVAFALLGILNLKGPLRILKTDLGFIVSSGIATWFTFGFAYYGYYNFPFLGIIWYFISLILILMSAAFFYLRRKIGSKS